MISSFRGKYRFLSNFYPSPLGVIGEYATVEHAYQAEKAVRADQRFAIRTAHTPALARKLGRTCDVRPDWEHVKLAIMFDLLTQKFRDGSALADQLLATGDHVLMEGNNDSTGENWLGRLLMLRRSQLKAGV